LRELLLDASIWLASVNSAEEAHAASSTLLALAARGECALSSIDLALYEVASVAMRTWRSSEAAVDVVGLVEKACGDALQRVDEELLREAVAIADKHEISVYDAAYVAAARRRGAQLVSGDGADLVGPGLAMSPAEAIGG
jgi:predicted nucleic acid-binding protein